MIKAAFSLIILLSLALPRSAGADHQDFAKFELSLAGYQIGMSIDDASLVRPFDTFSTHPKLAQGKEPVTVGQIDNIYLHDIELSLSVEFHEDRLRRIIARFPSEQLDNVKTLMLQALGPAEDRSKITRRVDNSEARIIHYAWQFPTAKASLVAPVGNVDFGTLALQADSVAIRKERERSMQELRESQPKD